MKSTTSGIEYKSSNGDAADSLLRIRVRESFFSGTLSWQSLIYSATSTLLKKAPGFLVFFQSGLQATDYHFNIFWLALENNWITFIPFDPDNYKRNSCTANWLVLSWIIILPVKITFNNDSIVNNGCNPDETRQSATCEELLPTTLTVFFEKRKVLSEKPSG